MSSFLHTGHLLFSCGDRGTRSAVCFCCFLLLAGCGVPTGTGFPLAQLSPSMSIVSVDSELTLRRGNGVPSAACTWTTTNPAVLVGQGDGRFRAHAPGMAAVAAQCPGQDAASGSVVVTSGTPGPIVISKGGTYSGTWTSDDPRVPAVSIITDEPVILKNSVVTGRGDLININGPLSGARVTVKNVTGMALDPGEAGLQRGAFLTAQNITSLRVTHCSMSGVSYGLRVLSSTLAKLSLTRNVARDLEDRASDGENGLQSLRPSLGHFIFLYESSAPAGAEIAWNEVIDTIGGSSTEDVISLFKTQGAAAAPIRVHDNYMEGYSSTTTASYTGVGLIADGDSSSPVTAFVNFDANQMVHTAGSGIEIAVGHDIHAVGNRVVSCGMSPGGQWYAMPFVNAVILWNDYSAPDFYANVVEGTTGGLVKPGNTGQPVTGDIYARTPDLNGTDEYMDNDFTDPCLADGKINLGAEDVERAYWTAKLAAAHITLGDQHLP